MWAHDYVCTFTSYSLSLSRSVAELCISNRSMVGSQGLSLWLYVYTHTPWSTTAWAFTNPLFLLNCMLSLISVWYWSWVLCAVCCFRHRGSHPVLCNMMRFPPLPLCTTAGFIHFAQLLLWVIVCVWARTAVVFDRKCSWSVGNWL